MRLAALALTLSIVGCTETIRFDVTPLDGVTELRVLPASATIEITDLAPPNHTLQYAAIATYGDGTTRDITDLVTWAIDRDSLGAFETDGLFITSHEAAGYGTVAARIGGVQATGSLRVSIDATIVDATFPPPAAGLFAAPKPTVTDDPVRTPALVYPASGTVMPRVIASTLFQLEPGNGNDAFRITFENDVLRLRVETGADRWRADAGVQSLIAASAGPDPLRISIEGTAAGSPIYLGAPTELSFSSDLADATLYYWSSATNGIMRGGADRTSASKLYPPGGTCVGCHTVNRGGTSIAVAVDDGSATTFQLTALDVMSQQQTIQTSPSRPMGWATYAPDSSRIVVANDGILTMYDAAGTSLGVVPLPAQRYATHPDWSPDGTFLAVALSQQQPTNKDVRAASIALIPYANGTWGTPQILVTGTATSNNYFPRWSPDGTMLVFVRASGPSRGAASANLMLITATGGTPIELTNASHRVGGANLPDLANTMPGWAPRIGTRQFIAFASARPYGKVVASGPSQIWITSIDPGASGDPSTPAFWLPCQDVTVLNYNPVWSHEIVTTL